ESPRHIRQLLRDQGLIAVSVDQVSESKGKPNRFLSGPGMSVKELALCTRQMATLVQAAMPLEEVLQAVAAQSERPKVKSLLLGVRSRVLEGHTLADGMADFPNAFPEMYRSTVAAGEHAGHLDLVLNELADYTEQREQARQKIQLALLYPGLLTVASIAIVSFLLAVVVPDVVKVFTRTGNDLPPLTAGLIAVSDFLNQFGLHLLLLLCLGFLAFSSAYRKPGFRLAVDRWLTDFRLTR
ncbi:type II secretion system F family protein, partial [Oceanospirillum sp. HFRX-1_2]